MSTFTPGPWSTAPARDMQGEASIWAGDCWKVHIADVGWSEKSLAEYNANARLIAAAPDLHNQHDANLVDLELLAMAIRAGDPAVELLLRVDTLRRNTMRVLAKATESSP